MNVKESNIFLNSFFKSKRRTLVLFSFGMPFHWIIFVASAVAVMTWTLFAFLKWFVWPCRHYFKIDILNGIFISSVSRWILSCWQRSTFYHLTFTYHASQLQFWNPCFVSSLWLGKTFFAFIASTSIFRCDQSLSWHWSLKASIRRYAIVCYLLKISSNFLLLFPHE